MIDVRRGPLAVWAAGAVMAIGVLGGCAAPGAPASPVRTALVDLPPSYRFAPAAIVVDTGTSVTWTNSDHFTHSIQLLDGGLPGTPLVMDPGASVTFRFDRAGVFHYQCHLHPQNMQGTVTVGP